MLQLQSSRELAGQVLVGNVAPVVLGTDSDRRRHAPGASGFSGEPCGRLQVRIKWVERESGTNRRSLELCQLADKFMVDGGIKLIKFWLEVGKAEHALVRGAHRRPSEAAEAQPDGH